MTTQWIGVKSPAKVYLQQLPPAPIVYNFQACAYASAHQQACLPVRRAGRKESFKPKGIYFSFITNAYSYRGILENTKTQQLNYARLLWTTTTV
jgi:hypothetical protein